MDYESKDLGSKRAREIRDALEAAVGRGDWRAVDAAVRHLDLLGSTLAGRDAKAAKALESKSKIPGMSLRAHLEMAIGLSMVHAGPAVTGALRDAVAILDGAPATEHKSVVPVVRFGTAEMIASALRDRAKAERSWPHPSPMDIEFAVLCEKAADVLMEKRKPFQSITAGVETGMAGALDIHNNPDHVMIECPDGTSVRVGRENFNESKAEE